MTRSGGCQCGRIKGQARGGPLLPEQRLHVGRDLGVESRCDVAVGIERERDGAMAEEFLDNLGVHAAIQQMGGRRMPKVVDPDAWDRRLIEGSMKPFRRPGSIDGSANRRREDQPRVGPLRSSGEPIRPA